MSIDYQSSLSRLRARRMGTDHGKVSILETIAKVERYQKRVTTDATQYTLGAMQEVDPDYTRVSNEEALRISEALRSGLTTLGRSAEYLQQGSVPANTHIRGASDVDLLVILGEALSYDATGCLAATGWYIPWYGSLITAVGDLRVDCEGILERRYYSATVDKSKNKSIRLSDGSLKRDIDVVPAHWTDNVTYQSSQLRRDRGVHILDKSVPITSMNLPFLHIDQLETGDRATDGGLKMAIRLLKNIKADSSRRIDLSSYDMASLMWNCEPSMLTFHHGHELAVLLGTDQWLETLVNNPTFAAGLQTPDGIRKVLDEQTKFTALAAIAAEVAALRQAVATEWLPVLKSYTFAIDARSLLESVAIPG
ncbi:hypothetical protein FHS95_003775 [Sphingomonas naasensis]|uniref:cGAS/DncV-like nucleotidyltransferase C-terminal helical domain-containing protein n=1 Tax=Sphingomonas naasensis TaxID=1344951 RepID=A0A4V3QWE7_9SPHN|nr:hypothetical protein [Sphingomonas naasensis]NIJ22064.1 hypothetical protein [Sphingomonas naasensis]TGX42262.1 hypothetical protein E5A74_10425 [Sphingomonas naasensis]